MADATYQTTSFILQNKGIVARYVVDSPPPGTFLNLSNLEMRQENGISSRLGLNAITTNGLDTNYPLPELYTHTLGRMKSLAIAGAPVTYRYAATTALYRRAGDTQGAYTPITGNVLSGQRIGIRQYRPNLNSYPYTFFADSNAMLKDNGTLPTAQQMGGFAPRFRAPVSSNKRNTLQSIHSRPTTTRT